MNIDKLNLQRRLDAALARVQDQLSWAPDALIPADPDYGMPSATQAKVQTLLLPQALRARDDLIEPFVSALARLPSTVPAQPLQALHDLGGEDFELVSRLIAGAYFLSPEINQKLGYPGQQEMPYDPDYDEIMEVVQRIIDRGPVYIDPQTGQKAQMEARRDPSA